MALAHPQPDPVEPGQESVWDYPRPPALVLSERPARVEVDGVVIAASERAWRVLETSHPPAFYIPADDVNWEYFTLATANGTFCEWKGTASYWNVKVGETEIPGRAWSYADPSPRFAGLGGAVSFYPKQAESLADAMQQQAKAIENSMAKNTMTISQVFAEGTDSVRKTTEYIAQQSDQSNANMTAQMESLRNVSGKLLKQVHGLTQRFETQGQAIMSASQALDSSNAQIDSILERRHSEISSLLDTVSTKAQTLDEMMRSYSGIIEGSLVQVEERAKQITASLAHETTAQADSTIQEIERLRSSARQHTEQAVAELTGGFQSITSEVADQLGTLTTRFGETTREIRETAHTTADELEGTRQELTRRMQGLPEATRHSQEAVRKAVSDQLKALGTLSALSLPVPAAPRRRPLRRLRAGSRHCPRPQITEPAVRARRSQQTTSHP